MTNTAVGDIMDPLTGLGGLGSNPFLTPLDVETAMQKPINNSCNRYKCASPLPAPPKDF